MKNKKKVIGLMSGTSVNGIDAALVDIEGTGSETKLELIAFDTYPFSKKLKTDILEISSSSCTAESVCHLNFYLGSLFANASVNIAKKANVPLSDIDLIGSHGQTIYHAPTYNKNNPFGVPSTLQIGEPSVIAEATGATVIADFRTRDMAVGGVGAPLTPYANFILFSDPSKKKIVQNIGGISNLTVLPGDGEIDSIISFDSGPGNMIIDSLMSLITNNKYDYDHNGKMAKSGTPDKGLCSKLLTHPFIITPPPKATGREDFGIHFTNEFYTSAKNKGLSNEDIIATATAFTIESIVKNYEQFVFPKFNIDEIIISGGGVYNIAIFEGIKKRLPQIEITTSEKYNIPSTALEAVSFAILANDSLAGIPNNLPNVTGAKKKVVLGKIVP